MYAWQEGDLERGAPQLQHTPKHARIQDLLAAVMVVECRFLQIQQRGGQRAVKREKKVVRERERKRRSGNSNRGACSRQSPRKLTNAPDGGTQRRFAWVGLDG